MHHHTSSFHHIFLQTVAIFRLLISLWWILVTTCTRYCPSVDVFHTYAVHVDTHEDEVSMCFLLIYSYMRKRLICATTRTKHAWNFQEFVCLKLWFFFIFRPQRLLLFLQFLSWHVISTSYSFIYILYGDFIDGHKIIFVLRTQPCLKILVKRKMLQIFSGDKKKRTPFD